MCENADGFWNMNVFPFFPLKIFLGDLYVGSLGLEIISAGELWRCESCCGFVCENVVGCLVGEIISGIVDELGFFVFFWIRGFWELELVAWCSGAFGFVNGTEVKASSSAGVHGGSRGVIQSGEPFLELGMVCVQFGVFKVTDGNCNLEAISCLGLWCS